MEEVRLCEVNDRGSMKDYSIQLNPVSFRLSTAFVVVFKVLHINASSLTNQHGRWTHKAATVNSRSQLLTGLSGNSSNFATT